MGAELIAEEGVLKGLILSLERGEEWIIGRDPDLCTILIEDPKVSRQHLRILRKDDGYFFENLSATNPILVNNAPLTTSMRVEEGEEITIGGTLFRFYPQGAPVTYSFAVEHPHEEPEEDQEEEPAEEEPTPEVHPEKRSEGEEEFVDEDFFEEPALSEMKVDLTHSTRFIIKVLAGPNTGAEFALDLDRDYLIGTDTTSCDIVFNDLSVSREHARLFVSQEGIVILQDLESRNGVFVDKERITGPKTLTANAVVMLGTSAFLLIDKEAPSETIAAPSFEAAEEEVPEEESEEMVAPAASVATPVSKGVRRPLLPIGSLILALVVGGLAVLFGVGIISLLQTHEIAVVEKDYLADLQNILKKYPAVRFTYNPSSGKLFLLGHVRNGVEHKELLYQLRGLGFITGCDDNIVNDEAVWQEMNILLSKHADFKGVSMHSPNPGVFVITGYLQTEKQAANLTDYLNVNFNYLSLLQNRVVIEEGVVEEATSRLVQQGFGAVNVSLTNGDLQMTGYISSTQLYTFDKLVEEFKKIAGIRSVRNFVVTVTPEQGVIDLNKKYPNRYHITGSSRHGDVNVNVVVNGKILTRGDCIDGYTITSIQPNIIFLEREGLKYKMDYNKCY